MSLRRMLIALCLTVMGAAGGEALAQREGAAHRPVKAIAPRQIEVVTPAGRGTALLYVDRDWSAPLPDIERVVVVLHGHLRNADVYKTSAEAARSAAGSDGQASLMIVPQFLATQDVKAWGLGPSVLHWGTSSWMGGEPAQGPAPLSAFDVLDAILARLADARIFPALRAVVVAGHSGGGQLAARYGVAGRGEASLATRGIRVRYVIANPSSYLYFSQERPDGRGGLARFDGTRCASFNQWKYGLETPVPYVAAQPAGTMEAWFAARDVIYLLGTADTDPDHPALDKSCAAEAQGLTRYARGVSYIAYLRARHGSALKHRRWDVPDVGHNGDRMLTSACGLAALFDKGSCATQR